MANVSPEPNTTSVLSATDSATKLSKKQLQEIDFFEQWGVHEIPFTSTAQERAEYIQHTVYGLKKQNIYNATNRLFLAKRSFDMTFKMWRRELPSSWNTLSPLSPRTNS